MRSVQAAHNAHARPPVAVAGDQSNAQGKQLCWQATYFCQACIGESSSTSCAGAQSPLLLLLLCRRRCHTHPSGDALTVPCKLTGVRRPQRLHHRPTGRMAPGSPFCQGSTPPLPSPATAAAAAVAAVAAAAAAAAPAWAWLVLGGRLLCCLLPPASSARKVANGWGAHGDNNNLALPVAEHS